MIPLQDTVNIRQLAFKNIRLELRHKNEPESKKYHLESVHYSVLHRGRVLLSEVEGEASSGQVRMNKHLFYVNLSVHHILFRYLRFWADPGVGKHYFSGRWREGR